MSDSLFLDSATVAGFTLEAAKNKYNNCSGFP